MKTASPVDRNIALATVEARSTFHTTTSADSAELEKPVENRAIISNVIFSLLLGEGIHVIRSDLLKEVDVLVGVELGHFMSSCRLRSVDFHVLISAIVHDQAVGQPDSVRLHGMASDVGVVSNIGVVEVCNPLLVVSALEVRRIEGRERGSHGEELLEV